MTEWKTPDGKSSRGWVTGVYADVGGKRIDITSQDASLIFEWKDPLPVPVWKARIVRAMAWALRIRVEPYTL